ncbi:SDR family NAD(P)-dependent oxidoreductase [Tistrella bauzanensis]|uniref:SDR family NAD(P)-dependent oxidoreductase n=1 Tax=Tistrella TaxID=171436 RepID=UPI0031F64218
MSGDTADRAALAARLAALDPARRALLERSLAARAPAPQAMRGRPVPTDMAGLVAAILTALPDAAAARSALAARGVGPGHVLGVAGGPPQMRAGAIASILSLGADALVFAADDPAGHVTAALDMAGGQWRVGSDTASDAGHLPWPLSSTADAPPTAPVIPGRLLIADGCRLVTVAVTGRIALLDQAVTAVGLTDDAALAVDAGSDAPDSLSALLWAAATGTTTIDAGDPEQAPAAALAACAGARILAAAPQAVGRLLDAAGGASGPLDRLAVIDFGGTPVPAALIRRLADRLPGVRMLCHYAVMAGAPLAAWTIDPAQITAAAGTAAAGRPLAKGRLRLVDGAGRPVPAGIVGRIEYRAPAGDDAAPDAPADDLPWAATGDAGRRTRDGLLEVTQRPDGGHYHAGRLIMPLAVETHIARLTGIADAHLRWRSSPAGPVLAAAVVASGAPDRAWAAIITHLPRHQRPHIVQLVDHLPLTASGEIDIIALDALPAVDTALLDMAAARLAATGVAVLSAGLNAVPDDIATPEGVAIETLALLPPPPPAAPPPADLAPVTIIRSGAPLPAPIFTRLVDILDHAAGTVPAGMVGVIRDGDGTVDAVSQAAFRQRAQAMAGGLALAGVSAGDRLLLVVADIADYLTGFWAAQILGAVPVPVSVAADWSADDGNAMKLVQVRQLLGRPAVLVDQGQAPAIAGFLRGHEADPDGADPAGTVIDIGAVANGRPVVEAHAASPDAPAILLLTSGSTGAPKAVVQTHRTLIARTTATILHRGYGPADVSLNWMPLDHVGAVVMFHLRDLAAGASQYHAPIDLVLADPLRWPRWMSRLGVTVSWAPNFAFGLVVAALDRADAPPADIDLHRLRVLINAGEAIVPRTARRFISLLEPHGLGPQVMKPEWGMSETCSAVICADGFGLDDTSDDDVAADLGGPVPGTAMRIFEARPQPGAGPASAPLMIGRLQIKGPTVTPGYLANPHANAEAFTPDGWFDTGDLGFVADDGTSGNGGLRITGRSKDSIIVNGRNLHAHEVEAVAEEVPGVAVSWTAAFAHRPPGADTDHLIVTYVPAASGGDDPAPAIRARIARRLGVAPAAVIAVRREDVPKTAIGKIQRARIRAEVEAGRLGNLVAGPAMADTDPTRGAVTLPLHRPVWRPVALRRAARRPVDGAAALVHHAGHGDAAMMIARLRDRLAACAGTRLRLVLAVRGLAAIDQGDPAPDADTAALAAWALSATQETGWLDLRIVDLDPQADAATTEAALAAEAVADDPEAVIAHRGSRRLARRLDPLDLTADTPRPLPIRPGGVYLIAGGLGGVGVEVAELLGRRFGARLLLVSRRDVAGCPVKAARLARLRAAGIEVMTAMADVADKAALSRAVAAARERWGGDHEQGFTLAGVIQMASDGALDAQWDGMADRGALADGDVQAGLKPWLDAKLTGTRNLIDLVAGNREALVLGFGSVNGLFGAPTLAGYAAANAGMAALIAGARLRGHSHAICIDWSMWDGLGLAEGAPEPARLRTRALGYRLIGRNQGLRALLAALALGRPHVVAGVEAGPHDPAAHAVTRCPRPQAPQMRLYPAIDAAAPASAITGHDRFGRAIAVAVRMSGTEGAGDNIGQGGRGPAHAGPASSDPPRGPVEARIAALWCDLLDRTAIGRHENFFEIGGHSLLLARMRARLTPIAGREVGMVELFRHPTIRDLARLVAIEPAEA